MTRRSLIALSALLAAGACKKSPTFTRDVAPIIFDRCAPCHRPHEAAPFSLLSFEDVREHAYQIADVIQSGYMPPWLPVRGVSSFADDRSLAPDQQATILRWIELGAPRGDPDDLPPAPTFPEGWALGTPELVVQLDEPFLVPAGGPDLFRTFVLPVPIEEPVFVRAMELRSADTRVLHHANIYLDQTRSTRHLDALDPGPGFSGMFPGEATSPEGQFLAWTPGKRRIGSALSSWHLSPGTDLVVQAHLQPTGREEKLAPKIGIYLTRDPPAPELVLLTLASRAIDIPAGAKDHVVELKYELPVDVEVLSVFPHAHFLARRIHARAKLPGGEERWLIRIDAWDFDWQDEYTYQTPLALPKGTQLSINFIYDNSQDNPRNPHRPPVRVFAGEESKDEMANFIWQVRTKSPAERRILQWHAARVYLENDSAELESILTKNRDPQLSIILGQNYQRLGRIDDAIRAYKNTIDIKPDFALAHNNLGVALMAKRQPVEAHQQLLRAHELIGCKHEPGAPVALGAAELHNNLGNALGALGRHEEAIANYELAINYWADYADAKYNAANFYAAQNNFPKAIELYRGALKSKPDAPDIHTNLAIALASTGAHADALTHFERSAVLAPSDRAHFNLGRAYEFVGDRERAIRAYERSQAPEARARVEALRRAN